MQRTKVGIFLQHLVASAWCATVSTRISIKLATILTSINLMEFHVRHWFLCDFLFSHLLLLLFFHFFMVRRSQSTALQ